MHGAKLWLVYTAVEYRALLGGLAAAGLLGEAGQGYAAARGAVLLDRSAAWFVRSVLPGLDSARRPARCGGGRRAGGGRAAGGG